MNKRRYFHVMVNIGIVTFEDADNHRAATIRTEFYLHYADLELAVFELGRLFCNGTNDLDYVIERLQVHKLDPQII